MASPIQISTATLGIFWFVLWTSFSFGAHFFARRTISLSTTQFDSWLTIIALTICQLLVGSIVLQGLIMLVKRGMFPSLSEKQKTLVISEDNTATEPSRMSLYLSHASATLATNAGIAFVNAGSVFTIKAFEPISSATLNSMLTGEKLGTHVIISLPLVVSGALGFVWTSAVRETATFGLAMAFVSNILFGVRNINLKLTHKNCSSVLAKLEFLQTMSWIAAASLLPVLFLLFGVQGSLFFHFSLADSFTSGLFHIIYTVISTCIILKYTSIVGHATCNLLKRILVAIFFFFLGKTAITSSNWVMGVIMLMGLLIYVLPDVFPIKGWCTWT